jgi:hypothetical protein
MLRPHGVTSKKTVFFKYKEIRIQPCFIFSYPVTSLQASGYRIKSDFILPGTFRYALPISITI